ncbi:DUF5062 family protein [Pleionea sediminis]|uniref:DUF5062 family protein n=1 Tax=Pleionea sediminis TaxID=2569479 RepID=UPI00118666E9|nr:DUF5062 family protein [Pleionea sediminis]
MKKLKNEKELLKKALVVGERYAQNRGYKSFSSTMSLNQKIESIYRLLVHDNLIQPMPEKEESLGAFKHRLAVWIFNKLPKDDPLAQ